MPSGNNVAKFNANAAGCDLLFKTVLKFPLMSNHIFLHFAGYVT
jgi:hypothetical protein